MVPWRMSMVNNTIKPAKNGTSSAKTGNFWRAVSILAIRILWLAPLRRKHNHHTSILPYGAVPANIEMLMIMRAIALMRVSQCYSYKRHATYGKHPGVLPADEARDYLQQRDDRSCGFCICLSLAYPSPAAGGVACWQRVNYC